MPRIFISRSATLALLGALLVSGCGEFNPFGNNQHPDQVVEGPRRSPALNDLSTAPQPPAATGSPVVLQTQPAAVPQPAVAAAQPAPQNTSQNALAAQPAQATSQSSGPFDGITAWFRRQTQPTTIQPSQQTPQDAYASRRAIPGNPETGAAANVSSASPAPQAAGTLPPPPEPFVAVSGQQVTPLEPSMAPPAAAAIPAPPRLSADTGDKSLSDSDLRARCAELKPLKTAHHHRRRTHKLASRKKHHKVLAKKPQKETSKQAKNKVQPAAPVAKVDMADKSDFPPLATVPNPPAELNDVKTTQGQQQQDLNAAKTEQDKKNEALQKEFFQSVIPPQGQAGQGSSVAAAPAASSGGVSVQFPAPAAPAAPAATVTTTTTTVTPALPAPTPSAAPAVPLAPQPAGGQPDQNAVPQAAPAAAMPASGGPSGMMPLPPPPPPPPPPGA